MLNLYFIYRRTRQWKLKLLKQGTNSLNFVIILTLIKLIELTVNTNDIDFLEDELSTIFAIETDKQTYVFSGYEVSEYYEEDNGLTKVVCIK